ncbi:MAG: transglycosylase SLT domain-containing protein [Pseudohongiellaceae bacterium]|jgi:hypothetical protein
MRLIFVFTMLTILSSCVSPPPENTANICSMFEERRSWYKAAKKAEKRWGTPVYVSMAIIEQESSFQGRAKPERTKLLWVIPWRRPSSAYGYAQVLDETWTDYKEDAGNWGARRSSFSDAMDFVGWYTNSSTRRNRIARNDAYNLYLAYHEGNGGWARGSYNSKGWLMDVARNVQNTANVYQNQYQSCERELGRNWFMRLFF